MIIEFCGIPGAGKTSAFNTALDELRERKVPVQTSGDLREAVGSASTHARLLWPQRSLLCLVVTEALRRRGALGDRFSGLRRTLVAMENQMLAQRRTSDSHEIVLFDENMLQRSFTVFLGPDARLDHARLERFARLLIPPTLVIHMRADPEAVLRQLPRRDRQLPGRLNGLPEEVQLRVLSVAAEMFDRLLHALERRHRTSLEVVRMAVSGNLRASAAEAGRRVGDLVAERVTARRENYWM